MLYTVRKTNTSLSKIDHALETENVTALEEIIKEEKEMKRSNNYSVSCNALDESKIKKDNSIAIKAFNTRNLQLAEYPCISCMKLCFNPLTRKILIKFFTWKSHHYFSFHASSKGPLKAPAMAECEAHALFVIHKTNLRFISYLNI